MPSNVQKKLFEKDLRSLEELAQLLHLEIDEKIKKILVDGKNWLCQDERGAVTKPSYKDIKQVTESAIFLLTETCQQVGGDWDKTTQEKVPDRSETRKSRKSSADSAELGDLKSLTAQMRAMEKKMTSLTQTVDRLKSSQDLTASSMGDMFSRFYQLQDDVKIKSEHINNTIQEMNTDTQRLQNDIDRMRNQIQDVEDRDKVTKRNIEVLNETVQSHTSELVTLGKKCVAFTAFVNEDHELVESETVTGYYDVTGNKDSSFCADTGIFTAPVKGMYGICVRHRQSGSGEIDMDVYKTSQPCNNEAAATPEDTNEEVWICGTHTEGDEENDFKFVVIEIEMGDTLHIVASPVSEDACLKDDASFSVFLLHT